jgi:hypothetical protein
MRPRTAEIPCTTDSASSSHPVLLRRVFDRADHLEGDEAVGLELAGATDDAHAAAAENAEQLVAGHLGKLPLLCGRQRGRHGGRVAGPRSVVLGRSGGC